MIFLKRASQADMEALLAETPKSPVLACLLESDLKLLNSGWLPVVIEEILVHEQLSIAGTPDGIFYLPRINNQPDRFLITDFKMTNLNPLETRQQR